MRRVKSKEEKLGRALAVAIEEVRSARTVCGTCGNVYKMKKCLDRFANAVSIIEDAVRRVGAEVYIDTLIHMGYDQYTGGTLKRNFDYIGYDTELRIVLNGKSVATVAIYEYVVCTGGVLVLKTHAFVSRFYDDKVLAGYCTRAPDIGCWSNPST